MCLEGGGGVQTLTKIAKILHVHIFSQGAYVKNWPACNDKKKVFFKHPRVGLPQMVLDYYLHLSHYMLLQKLFKCQYTSNQQF